MPGFTEDPIDQSQNPDAPMVYMEGDVAVYRASSLMSCQNALLMARLGYDGASPPKWMQERFDAGHDHEPLIISKYETHGPRVYGRQESVEMKVGPRAKIRGHIDGLVSAGDLWVSSLNGVRFDEPTFISVPNIVVVDAKALAPAGFDKWKKGFWHSYEYYRYQQFIYGTGLGAAGVLMAVKNKATDEHVWDYFELDAMGLSKVDIVKRVMLVERLAADGESAIFRDVCSPKSYPCPYFMFHEDKQAVQVKDGEVSGGLEAIAEIASRRDRAAVVEKEASELKRELDQQIVALYGDGVMATAKLPDYTVTTYQATYSGPDWLAIANALGRDVDDVKKEFNRSQTSPKTSVRVTPVKKKDV